MLQPNLRASLGMLERAIRSPLQFSAASQATNTLSSSPLSRFLLPSLTSTPSTTPFQVRHASHASQGAANKKARDPAGKRLGAKKLGEEYVVPGNIIYRQRGTKWWPGENCAMGRDHTIYATEAGYVKYYVDPERHPDRKYIGVCFERDGTLPTPRNAPTKRRLNLIAVPRDFAAEEAAAKAQEPPDPSNLPLRPGYMYREANWQIGRAAEYAGVKAKEFDRSNRWLAWRQRRARAEREAQMKSIRGKKKSAKKAK
ncbi:hypothetical protein VTN31DRAFT_4935 [Thermomyces dupontii]|uniref:mitochondrial 54S ribosomal protein bL27m n=1 Tax=Talaromyces thermophilus TaxID=28565 RepID=UPI003743EB09